MEENENFNSKWRPVEFDGSRFQNYRLGPMGLEKIEVKEAWKNRASSAYTLAVLGIIPLLLLKRMVESPSIIGILLLLVFGALFILNARTLWLMSQIKKVFNKGTGKYIVYNKGKIIDETSLDQALGLQIVTKTCRGSKGREYKSYELNLVLKGGKRINILDHGNLGKLKEDAQTLSSFLQIPIADNSKEEIVKIEKTLEE
jgi:hypothetical protein